jgi:predicted peroxiredoxin
VDYLMIESGGPAEGSGAGRFIADATVLAGQGASVALVLIQNGVAAAVAGTMTGLDDFMRRGGRLWIDEFSARQRALDQGDLISGARVIGMGDLADALLTPGVRAVWH